MEERLKDELNDVVTYMEMSKRATTEFDKKILRDIARDEYSHAKHIKEIMVEHDMKVNDAAEWEKATKAINEIE